MAPVTARVCVVTAGHLSTCPRMLKAADALHGAGYQVRVVSTRHVPWAWVADQAAMRMRSWTWRVVDYDHANARGLQIRSGARFRAAGAVAGAIGSTRVPLGIAIRGYSRMHDELVRAIVAEPADFVYGGTTGALAAVAAGARRLGVPYALDLEDFHSAEQSGPGSELAHALAERVEGDALPGAAFLTAGSPMIADAYQQKCGVRPLPIHNTFSMRFDRNERRDSGPRLTLYWFSQTLGPGRGLDFVVRAVGRARITADVHIRARAIPDYAANLSRLQAAVAPTVSLVYHAPAPPDDMVPLAREYDLGLSSEEGNVLNARLCLGNKIFTYLAAGVPVLMSATPAQARLAGELGPAALVYEPGDVDGLADQIRRWTADPAARNVARTAARAAAERRWHWEHPDDRGALLAAVHRVVPISVQHRWREQPCAS